MRLSQALLVGAASTAFAAPRITDYQLYQGLVEQDTNNAPVERFLVETAPGVTKWVTEEDKLEMLRNDINFMDITEHQDFATPVRVANQGKVKFPSAAAKQSGVKPLLPKLSIDPMKENLAKFSSFYTRYYKSSYGAESSKWLQGKIADTVKESKAEKLVQIKPFDHPWGQSSIIATIPGKSNKTVVIGAHQDSINMFFPTMLPAPGADDDGSGTVTILEALRVLLQDPDILAGKAANTLEFHWYSAEEGGLLGSQAIFQSYQKAGRDVRAMLQQDMTGFIKRTIAAGKKEALGVITDFVDPDLTTFIQKVITEYCDIPYVLTKCGYACSDHASASKAGYPSAFVIEGEMDLTHDGIHTDKDTIDLVDFGHMLQHAKLTLGLAYELAFADLEMS
ncbi:Zn-dependent exopeptidase [Microthyrium microscopicum]|uniref:Peptide hydrolase n=1 Tax=Microthyrium microscopicum TaxID=703497 RepID=A0A6A6UMX3_9PEZI|nr:Zn-dependent exopeptidase [Microthyrium microscopicum]